MLAEYYKAIFIFFISFVLQIICNNEHLEDGIKLKRFLITFFFRCISRQDSYERFSEKAV